jgi:Arc/MetJ family transcription regulator
MMRTTVTIDDALVDEAKRYSGISNTSHVINIALGEFNRKQALQTLVDLGGSEPNLSFTASRRRRING